MLQGPDRQAPDVLLAHLSCSGLHPQHGRQHELTRIVTKLIVMAGFMLLSTWVAVRAFRPGAPELSQAIKL